MATLVTSVTACALCVVPFVGLAVNPIRATALLAAELIFFAARIDRFIVFFSSLAVLHGARPGDSSTLFITEGGTYSGVYQSIVIVRNDGRPVTIDHATLVGPGDNIVCHVPCDLTVTNCRATTKSPGKFLVVWRFVSADVEHNELNGTGGMLFCDHAHTAKSAKVLYNSATNITGATGPDSCQKTSFIQFQGVHVPGLEIAWNQLYNERGVSATEDAISLLRSGGLPGSPALIHDNCIWGIFGYPAGGICSGSGIMAFDPGLQTNVTEGGYVRVFYNTVIAAENQAITNAGAHDIEVYSNRVSCDGTTTRTARYGYQAWNWDGKTPAGMFGLNTSYRDNFAAMKFGQAWSFQRPVASGNNVAGTSSDFGEWSAWRARVEAANLVIGPLPVKRIDTAQSPSRHADLAKAPAL